MITFNNRSVVVFNVNAFFFRFLRLLPPIGGKATIVVELSE